MSGLTATGLVIETLESIREGLRADLRAAFGTSINLEKGILADLVTVVSERLALLWELAEVVNSSQDPDAATGASLDAVCALTGTQREAAAPSTVTLTLTGTPATLVSSGSRASTASTDKEFETTADATIVALSAWAGSTAYVIGDRVTNASRTYVCITAGTSAASGGPTTTSDDITDGTVHWRYMGEGTGAVDVESQSVETGAIQALSGDITQIETPVGGWQSVINLLDADLGQDLESDEDLRVRREEELAGSGSATIDAIRANLLDVPGVDAVTVFHNPTDTTDADGMPPHSVEALVTGGDDQDIFDMLLASVAAGIQTTGTESGTSEDSQGFTHDVEFSRPDEIEIYVDVVLTYDEDLYPLDGDDQIKAAIVAFGDAQRTGKDAVASAIVAAAFEVPGVLDVSDVDIGTSPGPVSGTTIPITLRQLAVYDTSRITVSSSAATP